MEEGDGAAMGVFLLPNCGGWHAEARDGAATCWPARQRKTTQMMFVRCKADKTLVVIPPKNLPREWDGPWSLLFREMMSAVAKLGEAQTSEDPWNGHNSIEVYSDADEVKRTIRQCDLAISELRERDAILDEEERSRKVTKWREYLDAEHERDWDAHRVQSLDWVKAVHN